MEIVGKLLFIVVLSVGTAYGVIYLAGNDFLSSGLDRNLLDESNETYEDVDLDAYKEKLRVQYHEYIDSDIKPDKEAKEKDVEKPIWNDTVKKNTNP